MLSVEVDLASEESIIRVRVTGMSSLRIVISKDTPIILNRGNTVKELIDQLEEEFGSIYKKQTNEDIRDVLTTLFALTINGKLVSPRLNPSQVLKDGDKVVFFQWTGA